MLGVQSAALAHDPSAYGGLFRSRDFGRTWLNADVGLFLSGAVSLAVNPRDPNHLLLGTNNNLLVSHSAGRDWKQEAPDKLFGAVTAVAFLSGGEAAICATPAGLFRADDSGWHSADAPSDAVPARAVAIGVTEQRVYLVGRRALFMSDDTGRTWNRIEGMLPGEPQFTELVVAAQPEETLYAIVDGRVLASADGGLNWKSRSAGLPDAAIEALTADPAGGGHLWAAATGRLYRTDDGGHQWRAVGERLPEAATTVRGIAVDRAGQAIVVTTQRGLYRSGDAGLTWGLQEGTLPVHLEAKPLVRDPLNADTLYAGYSLMPYEEIWRGALEGRNLLSRLSWISLAGGVAFLLLLGLAAFAAARWLSARAASHP